MSRGQLACLLVGLGIAACAPTVRSTAAQLVFVGHGREPADLEQAHASRGHVLVLIGDAVYAPPAACLPATAGGDPRQVGGTGEDRQLGGGGEDRQLGGDGEDRQLGGGGEDRQLGGGGEGRNLGGGGEDRQLGGGGEDRQLGHDGEARQLGGGTSAPTCVRGRGGFTVAGASGVEYFDGWRIRPAAGGFVPDP